MDVGGLEVPGLAGQSTLCRIQSAAVRLPSVAERVAAGGYMQRKEIGLVVAAHLTQICFISWLTLSTRTTFGK